MQCPSCNTESAGRFCPECGAPLQGAHCAACRAALTPGANFCHRCGAAVGAAAPAATAAPRDAAAALPWAVAGIALLALVALVAGQRVSLGSGGSGGDSGANPGVAAAAPLRAPDISNMSPRERADRLFNRIMILHEQGKRDSVQFFAPMALGAFQALGALDLDQRYHLGRIGEVTGAVALARSQADTILRARPTHLLGLMLAADAARLGGDAAAARAFDRRLLAAEAAEQAAGLPEYQQHQVEIADALEKARDAGTQGRRDGVPSSRAPER